MLVNSLQKYLDKVFKILGAKDSFVDLEVVPDDRVYAYASGFNISNIVFGKISVSKGLINKLSEEEIKFVLIHEAVHIYMNHIPIKIMGKSIRDFLLALGLKNPLILSSVVIADIINLFKYGVGLKPSEVELTKEQELQADIWGVLILGDPSIAINCLKKLVDNDLDKPSHLWEVLGVKLPVMTVRERIHEIQKRIKILKEEGIL